MTQIRNYRWLILSALLILTSACSLGPTLMYHSFSFDTLSDNPDSEVLDYRYGDSKISAARANPISVRDGHVRQALGITGSMLRGDSLYVKWRVKSTGEVYEDTVDLRDRLPANITDHEIHFVVRGPQLTIYLISPERRDPSDPPNGPRMYDFQKVTTIYPDSSRRHPAH